jgi:dolichyl-phosphate-mannose--protein O-mannosyl transferase
VSRDLPGVGCGRWQVLHGAYNKPCARGTPILNGDIIRLQHMGTRRWLHSHLHQSPLSAQQEVREP